MPGMDERGTEETLRDMLQRAVASEPPMGPTVHDALRDGIRRRRRRRVSGAVTCLGVLAAALVAVPSITGTRDTAAAPATDRGTTVNPGREDLYVECLSQVTPIDVATGTARAPIRISGSGGGARQAFGLTPNGKTLYVPTINNEVVPVSTATGKTGKPIGVGISPIAFAFTPDGKTAYVLNAGSATVTPISVATGQAGPPIKVGSGPDGIAITPDGKTAYVSDNTANTVTPINVATNTAGPAIKTGKDPIEIVIVPGTQ